MLCIIALLIDQGYQKNIPTFLKFFFFIKITVWNQMLNLSKIPILCYLNVYVLIIYLIIYLSFNYYIINRFNTSRKII